MPIAHHYLPLASYDGIQVSSVFDASQTKLLYLIRKQIYSNNFIESIVFFANIYEIHVSSKKIYFLLKIYIYILF